jgi:predicted nucleic acid-binding Zn ribbon protein
MAKNDSKNMLHIGNILTKSLKSCRLGGDGDMLQIWEVWDGAVGETVARHARPSAFKGCLLQINVSSSSWLYHLNFMKKDLIDKLNEALGSPMVRELTFKIGKIKS